MVWVAVPPPSPWHHLLGRHPEPWGHPAPTSSCRLRWAKSHEGIRNGPGSNGAVTGPRHSPPTSGIFSEVAGGVRPGPVACLRPSTLH